MKRCYKCHRVLSESEFYKNKTKKDGLCDECKECNIQQRENYSIRNKDKISQYKKEYYQKNRDMILKLRKNYRNENREKILQIERKHHNKHPETHRKKNRKHSLKKKQLFEDFTNEDWLQKVEATEGVCPICGRSYSEIHPFCATLDHTPPISKAPKGYHYTIDDITPMCGSCNTSKGASF